MTVFVRVFLCGLLWAPLGWANPQSIHFQPCALTGSGGNGNLHAECGTWLQPLNPREPNGQQIELFVARLPTTAVEPAADAFTLINGGPGASSVDLLVDFAQIVRAFTRQRDVIVIDQRGTGRSSPLTCDDLTDGIERPDTELALKLTRQCIAGLPHDPRFFSTTVAVTDLEALRKNLGYEQLSIYGVSYGTRVAMQYQRLYPEYTRAVIIDGVVPPQRILGGDIAIHSHNTLNAVLRRCSEDVVCQTAFPDLADEFDQLADRLKTTTIPLQVPHPITGLSTSIDLNYGHLAMWLRFSLYSPEMSSLIPVIIHQAAVEENYLPIASNALRLVHNITTAVNYGMHNAVVCTEDAPFFAQQEVDFSALDNSYLGRDMYDTLAALCSIWPPGEMHPAMNEPLQSTVPTLVLSGGYDPITPPEWGAMVLPGLSRARHIVAPGQGHGVIARGCLPAIVLDFVENPDVSAIDDSCVQHLAPYPFFINLMGPPP